MMTARFRRWTFAFAFALLAAAAIIVWSRQGELRATLPTLPPAATSPDQAHLPFGPVRPRKQVPHIKMTLHDGARADLAATRSGRWTLAQLIFTNCTTTCPLQGAIFQRTQQVLKESGEDAELLSISIDPEHDDPAALAGWREKFSAGSIWRAAVVDRRDVGAVLDFFNGRKSGLDVHDARVYFIDPQGRLAYATEDLPDPLALLELLRAAKQAGDDPAAR